MSVALYMDVHVRWAITAGLRRRGVDVLTAQEDGAARFEDPALLDLATELGRILVSQDDDLLQEASRRQARGERFSGVGSGSCRRKSILLSLILSLIPITSFRG